MGGNKAMTGIDGCNDRHLPVFLTSVYEGIHSAEG